ncbi:hypothetical protein FF011L_24940 [Roseimaritima multifibrata]|uniref:BioF2-like acetyltransferase domain-containing protein n=1 Tax=Roseimaritima multifibrata TaxID=1930274 RepID=A0A517MFQ6_9BACT|nr:GNAT family N-acetyltransferase [Roseimaritima multifibrata]QDS93721.1 hypothetical protein FF011L_24940 [Roseimaritima multifibrata]
MLTIERENDFALLDNSDQWDAISGGIPFRQSHWLRTWWNAFAEDLGPSAEPYLVTARDENQNLVAVLPLYRFRHRGRSVLSAIGQGAACTDFVSVLSSLDVDRLELGRQIGIGVGELSRSPADAWDRIDLDGMVEGDDAIGGLASGLQECRATVQAISRMSVWARSTDGLTWDEYTSQLSRTNRRKTRQRSLRVESTDDLAWKFPETEAEVVEATEMLIKIHQKRWTAVGQPGSFALPAMKRFIGDLTIELFRKNQLRMPILCRSGEPIAVELQIQAENRVLYNYSTGMDCNHEDIEPGHIMTMSSLRYAFENGLLAMNLMRGDEPYKARMRAEPQKLIRMFALAPARSTPIQRAAWQAAWDAKQWVRHQLGRPSVDQINLTGESTESDEKILPSDQSETANLN